MTEANPAKKPAEKGATQAKDMSHKVTAATEHVAKALEDTSSKLTRGAQDYADRVIEIARANANAAFDYAQALLGAKSPTEFAELTSEYAKAQVAALGEQTKELGAIAQKVCAEAVEPIKTGVGKAFGPVA
jgi:phasin